MTTAGTCAIDGCDRRARSRGLCNAHYLSWWRESEADRPPAPKREFKGGAFIKSLIEGPLREECVVWPLARTKNGYGRASLHGRSVDAHRLVCMLAHGEPPSDRHHAAHICGKGREGCVNPSHLRWATPKENKADQLRHGTAPCGEKSPHARFSDEEARAIYAKRGQLPAAELARQLGWHKGGVCAIWRRRRYASATEGVSR